MIEVEKIHIDEPDSKYCKYSDNLIFTNFLFIFKEIIIFEKIFSGTQHIDL